MYNRGLAYSQTLKKILEKKRRRKN